MLSKIGMICKVAECGSFSQVANDYGYAQSTVSQTIKSLEDEMGITLLRRKRNGVEWTSDGLELEPYFRAIYQGEKNLEAKRKSLYEMEETVIRIGSFTSVTRDILPRLMTQFKEEHPNVRFELFQGQYDNINKWIQDGTIDLGFISSARTKDLAFDTLYKDSMIAVLPMNHPLAKEKTLSLDQLTNDTFILLDEGLYNTTLEAFSKKQLKPAVEYVIYDDYSIISMVRNRLGISTLFRNVIEGFEDGLSIHEIDEPIERTICLARRKDKALSYAAEKFRLLAVRELNEI